MVVPGDYSSKYVLQKSSLEGGKKKIGSLESHIGVLDDKFEKLIAAGKLRKIWSRYNKRVVRAKT